MRVAFVTGAGGQDGGYLVEQLLAEGTEVHVLAYGDDPGGDSDPGVTRHAGDLCDVEATRALLLDVAPDEVYNLAALSSVADSWRAPERTALVNGSAAAALMESARLVQEATGRPVSFVQASSAEIFGHPPASPQDESTPVRPTNPYGAAKAYAHLMAHVYRQRGLAASSAILYNHESPRRPHRFVTRKITSTVAAIADGRAERLVLGNLDSRRDWGWAPDHVDALVRCARADRPGDYVVATGEGRSVRDFVAAAFAAAGIDDWAGLVDTDRAFARSVDAAELVGDASRARRELGWSPTVSFEELVRRMVAADLALPAGGQDQPRSPSR